MNLPGNLTIGGVVRLIDPNYRRWKPAIIISSIEGLNFQNVDSITGIVLAVDIPGNGTQVTLSLRRDGRYVEAYQDDHAGLYMQFDQQPEDQTLVLTTAWTSMNWPCDGSESEADVESGAGTDGPWSNPFTGRFQQTDWNPGLGGIEGEGE